MVHTLGIVIMFLVTTTVAFYVPDQDVLQCGTPSDVHLMEDLSFSLGGTHVEIEDGVDYVAELKFETPVPNPKMIFTLLNQPVTVSIQIDSFVEKDEESKLNKTFDLTNAKWNVSALEVAECSAAIFQTGLPNDGELVIIWYMFKQNTTIYFDQEFDVQMNTPKFSVLINNYQYSYDEFQYPFPTVVLKVSVGDEYVIVPSLWNPAAIGKDFNESSLRIEDKIHRTVALPLNITPADTQSKRKEMDIPSVARPQFKFSRAKLTIIFFDYALYTPDPNTTEYEQTNQNGKLVDIDLSGTSFRFAIEYRNRMFTNGRSERIYGDPSMQYLINLDQVEDEDGDGGDESGLGGGATAAIVICVLFAAGFIVVVAVVIGLIIKYHKKTALRTMLGMGSLSD